MQINNLSTESNPQASDLLALWSTGNSDTRKLSLTALTTFLETNLNLDAKKDSFTTQYSAPNAEAFNTQVRDDGDNTWLILTPVTGYTNMTITFPDVANLTDKQEIQINISQSVTNINFDKNGATAITGAPTSLQLNDKLRFKYDAPFKTWYRIS